jgi:hypothetical protein
LHQQDSHLSESKSANLHQNDSDYGKAHADLQAPIEDTYTKTPQNITSQEE